MKVLSIEKVDVNTTLYDLQIKGLPYYYANNMVVHNSTPALGAALASKGIDTGSKSEKTNAMKLDKTALQSVGLDITDKLVKRKNLRTQLNTYIKKFTEIDEGRIRYKLYDTATARLASGNDLKVKSRANYYFLPLNFQNLTKPSGGFYSCKENSEDPKNILGYTFEYITDNTEELGVFRANNPEVKIVEGFSQKNNIRNAITTPNPHDDWVLSSIDFSAQELRVIANYFKPKNFVEAFKNNEDLHLRMAKAIWGEEAVKENKKKLRGNAKAVNFGVAYGATEYTFIQRGMPPEEANKLFEDYWKANPDFKAGQEKLIKQIYRQGGNVYTQFGRPRRLKSALTSDIMKDRKAGEREGLNFVIQGSCADIIRKVLWDLYDHIFKVPENQEEIKFAGTIHDEVLYYIRKDSINKWLPKVVEIMEQKNVGEIPLIVEVELGYTYGDRYVFDYDNVSGQWLPRFI